MEIDQIINSSNLSIEVKYYLNKILVEDFNNDEELNKKLSKSIKWAWA